MEERTITKEYWDEQFGKRQVLDRDEAHKIANEYTANHYDEVEIIPDPKNPDKFNMFVCDNAGDYTEIL